MTLLTVEERAGFRRELALMLDKGKDENRLRVIVEILKRREPLPRKYRDHKLLGKWEGYRECRIEHDWLLIYKVIKERLVLYLVSTGTHDDL